MNALEGALAFAASGFRVFPCHALEKKPKLNDWPAKASADSKKVRKWFEGNSLNYGVYTGERTIDGAARHVAVIDLDVKGDKNGIEELDKLAEPHGGLPTTFSTKTPSGGRHLYFFTSRPVKTDTNIAPGIDVRGVGGQVIGPGSVLPNGEYSVLVQAQMSECPEWLEALLPTPGAELTADSTPLPGIDAEYAERKSIEYLAALPVSTAGGRNGDGFAVAAQIKNYGCSESECAALMREHWQCEPMLDADELHAVIRSAYKRSQRARGADNPQAIFGDAAPGVAVEELTTSRRYNLLSVGELLARSPPAWLVRGLLPSRGLAVVYGAPGSGKSFLVLDLAAAIARGLPWAGQRVRQGAVVYVGLEGQMGPRASAYLLEHGISANDVAKLHIIERQSLNLLDDKAADGRRLIADIKASDIGPVALVIIDTLNRSMPGGNENASEDMGTVIDFAGKLSAGLNCLAMFVHHSGKDAGKGARGHSSLLGAADAELEVSRGADGATRFLEATKIKDGEDGSRYAFKLKPVDLGATRDHDPDADPSERDGSCVVEGLGRALAGLTDKATKWTAHRTNAMEALRTAFDRSQFGAVNWDDEGLCSIDDWRTAYFELVPIGDALEGAELRTAQNSRARNFSNSVEWLTAEKLVTVQKKKGRSGYRIVR